MNFEKDKLQNCTTFKYIAKEGDKIAGRAYLHVIYNDDDDVYYGLLADVKIKEEFRKQGIGTKFVELIIEEAKKNNCKWLTGTSRYTRPHVHKWYEKLGFTDRGKEFRIDF